MPCLLYAVILAQPTSLSGPRHGQSQPVQLSAARLSWEQLCREDTLTAANASIVDYHHSLPLTQDWGAGRLSSSDGQRFAVRARGPDVSALPLHLGHCRRGLQIYSWTFDQYSQYPSRP